MTAQPGAATAADLRPLLTGLGVPVGERATLLQFSTAFCAPCRATRTVLRGVAAELPDVVYAEVDAESHLDLVRQLGVAATPTTLVIDGHGREVRRAEGRPGRSAVRKALPS